MISERSIAAKFDGFWSDSLPLLTASFVKVFNEASSEYLDVYTSSGLKEQLLNSNINKPDLVAEFSFQLAKLICETSTSIDSVRNNESSINIAFERSLKFLKKYGTATYNTLLNVYEVEDAFNLAGQYELFFSHLNAQVVEFNPQIVGAGFLKECSADLSVDSTLYEIKTVSRNISGRDIKQLLLYLALQYSTGNQKWLYAGFYNPRKALHYRFPVEHLIENTSGGRSSSEVFMDIIDFLANRGVELDTSF